MGKSNMHKKDQGREKETEIEREREKEKGIQYRVIFFFKIVFDLYEMPNMSIQKRNSIVLMPNICFRLF